MTSMSSADVYVRPERTGAQRRMERGDYIETPRSHAMAGLIERGMQVALVHRMPAGGRRYGWSIFNRDGRARPIVE